MNPGMVTKKFNNAGIDEYIVIEKSSANQLSEKSVKYPLIELELLKKNKRDCNADQVKTPDTATRVTMYISNIDPPVSPATNSSCRDLYDA
jgi:hypothetical protein